MSSQKDSPYTSQRKNTVLTLSWFVIATAFMGVGSYLLTQSPVENPENVMQLNMIFGGMALLLMVMGVFAGVLPAIQATNAREMDSSAKIKAKYFIAGAFFELGAVLGLVCYFLTRTWYVYGVSILVLAIVVFVVLIPLCNTLFDRLELLLQRSKDGGQTVTSKKTTYEL